MVADAGPLGYQTIAAHGHADALAFTLSVGGLEFLVDPGTYAFHAHGAWRQYFRGTAAHNTLRVDGKDQSESGGDFMWLKKARAACTLYSSSDGYDLFEGWQAGALLRLGRGEPLHVMLPNPPSVALETDRADYQAVNVGTGQPTTVRQVADAILDALDARDLAPTVLGKFREGDIRHCYADITLARTLLGYEPRVAFDKGMRQLVTWVRGQQAVDGFDQAHDQLVARGLA